MSVIGLLGIVASLLLFAWLSYKGVHTYGRQWVWSNRPRA